MPDQPDNIYRKLQEDVTAALVAAGVEAMSQVEPRSDKEANDALNSSGAYVVVGYPTVAPQENGLAVVELPVQVTTNAELASGDGFDLALKIVGELEYKRLADEWWSELRLVDFTPAGTEDGLPVFLARIQCRTVQVVAD